VDLKLVKVVVVRVSILSWWQTVHDLHLGGRLVWTRLRVLAKAGWVATDDRGDLDDHWSITIRVVGYLAGYVDVTSSARFPREQKSEDDT